MKWQYLTIRDSARLDVDKYGEEGWELVSVVNAWASLDDEVITVYYFFKKPM